jgi:DNA-directed RNA polymerase specialized sigma24 family protein
MLRLVVRPLDSEFADFFAEVEPRLRRALAATHGALVGRESACAALVWAWENWERARALENPIGYLYRVGQTAASRDRPRDLVVGRVAADVTTDSVDTEPRLMAGLQDLSTQQRAAVLLVHGYGYSLREAAAVLDIAPATLRIHIDRGLARLRAHLEVEDVS